MRNLRFIRTISAAYILCLGAFCLRAQTNDAAPTNEISVVSADVSNTNTTAAADDSARSSGPGPVQTNAFSVATPAIAPAVTNVPASSTNVEWTTVRAPAARTNDAICCVEKTGKPNYRPLTVSVEGGSTGVGGSVGWRFADHLGVRGGANYFPYDYNGTIEDVDYNSHVRMLSEFAALEIFPSKKHSLFFSVGALFNQNELKGSPDPTQNITINGVTFTPAEFGTMNLRIKQQPVCPYVSLGANFFGGRKHHWSLGGEIGIAYGQWDVSLTHSGGSNPPGLQTEIDAQRKKIDDQLKKYPFWPIAKLRFSLSF